MKLDHSMYSKQTNLKVVYCWNKMQSLNGLQMLKCQSRTSLHAVQNKWQPGSVLMFLDLIILRMTSLDTLFLLSVGQQALFLACSYFFWNQGFCSYKMVLIKKSICYFRTEMLIIFSGISENTTALDKVVAVSYYLVNLCLSKGTTFRITLSEMLSICIISGNWCLQSRGNFWSILQTVVDFSDPMDISMSKRQMSFFPLYVKLTVTLLHCSCETCFAVNL